MSKYKIKGLCVADNTTASSFAEAKRKLRACHHRDRLHIWGPFRTEHGEGWTVYPSRKALQDDKAAGGARGAYLPMIERIDTKEQS